MEIKEFKTAMDTLKYISADDDVRAMVDLRQRNINDRNSEETIAIEKAKAKAMERGEAAGVKKGKAEGLAEKARETAMKMLADGMPVEIIRKYTGLTLEEIAEVECNQRRCRT